MNVLSPMQVYLLHADVFGCYRETDLDEVMQINNVFMNVSKGQVASSEDLKKAFNKTDVIEIVKEVRSRIFSILILHYRGYYASHLFRLLTRLLLCTRY